MKALKDLTMQKVAQFFGLAGSLLVAIGLMLISCAPDTTAPTLQPQPANGPPSAGDAPVAINVSSDIPRVPPFTDTECLDCHTDQPTLVDLAQPADDAHEALSSGPG